MQGRRLIVMRHAKAGELPGGPDAERALRARGRRDAAAAGAWLRERGFVPDAVICSTARRARQTWLHVAPEFGTGIKVSNDPLLYDADAGQLLGIISATQADIGTLMYVGHNPAAADLVALLTGQEQEFPTAAVAVVEQPERWEHWASAAPGAGPVAAFWSPRAES